MDKTTKYINFHNDSDFPVMIDSWVDGSNALKCFRVGSREKLIIHSSVGEWHINAMLTNKEDRKLWDDNEKLKKVTLIGKFRSDPCAMGKYSWMEYNGLYDCIYSELETPIKNVKGLITFYVF